MYWHHVDNGSTIQEIITKKSGMSVDELINPKKESPYSIDYLGDVLDVLLSAIEDGIPITIVGDYDADGITSTAILMETLTFLGAKPKYRIPKRVSEGYGLSIKIIDEINDGLILTVDNGIAAVDEIAEAKRKGLTVLVMDHHLPKDVLPPADFIVDPHIKPESNGFEHYCGAGLALKLTEMALEAYDTEAAKALLYRATALAAIGTVADVVPLIGDNRRIVKEGLQIMENEKKVLNSGIRALMEEAKIYAVTETDIGFKIGPMLNSPGRMLDDGANLSVEVLLCAEKESAVTLAKEIFGLNEQRKSEVNAAMIRVEKIIEDECLYGMAPLCIVDKSLKEGIVGIVTGKVAEKYKVPAFVFTESMEPGVLKGSGRSYGNINLEEVVKSAAGHLMKYGGHTGAAGLSVMENDYQLMVNDMTTYMSGYESEDVDEIQYDLEIDPKDISKAHRELEKYAPFGEGNPKPVFRIDGVLLYPRAGSYFKIMGKDAEHLKLFSNGFSVVCFNGANKFQELGTPRRVDLIGYISENTFQYSKETQIEAIEFEKAKKDTPTNSLLEALRVNGTI